MKQSDIDILRKKGYTEEEIQVALNTLSKISVSPQDSQALGLNRDDRSIVVTTNDGKAKKTSSIMMGYNKDGIRLENGDYVSALEFEQALQKEFESDSKDVIYVCKKTGKKVDNSNLIEEILKKATMETNNLRLRETNAIKNQDVVEIKIEDNKEKKEFNKGILMLGNSQILLPSGDYVLGSEIIRAINDYVKMIPDQDIFAIDSPMSSQKYPVQSDDVIYSKEEEKYEVIKRITKKMSVIPIIIALLSTLLSGLKIENKYDYVTMYNQTSKVVYDIDTLVEKNSQEIVDEVIKQTGDIKIGDKIEVQDGLAYHSSSDFKYGGSNRTGVFGQNNPLGEYNVDYISIVYNKKIVKLKYDKNQSLEQNLNLVAQHLGVDVNELESYIHLGGPISGWVDVDDIIKSRINQTMKDRRVLLDEKENFVGVDQNFNGTTVTINDSGEDVIIKIVDENGNVLSKGSVITGSNGEKYRLQDINVEEGLTAVEQKIPAGRNLSWSIHNMSKEYALASIAVATTLGLLTRKKEKEMINMTGNQIDELVSAAKNKFDNESEFISALKTITNKKVDQTKLIDEYLKNELISQNVTVEDVNNLGGMKK